MSDGTGGSIDPNKADRSASPAPTAAPRRDWASIALVACAAIVTIAAVGREVRGWNAPRREVPQGMTPTYVDDWQRLLSAGRRIGAADAPLVVVEFTDLQCPVCRTFAAAYEARKATLGDSIALVIIHYPLGNHPEARPAAQAAECAAEQGKFPEFVTAVFARQDSLGKKPWRAFAKDAGVADLRRFDLCAADTTLKPLVQRGLAVAESLGVQATPTLVINGWKYRGAPRRIVLDSAIRSILAGKAPSGAK